MADEKLEHVFEIADSPSRLRGLIQDNPVAFAAWHMGRTMGWDDDRTMRAVTAALCLWGKLVQENAVKYQENQERLAAK